MLLVLYILQNVFDDITLLKTSRSKLICLKLKEFIFNLAAVAARWQHAKRFLTKLISLFINCMENINTQVLNKNDLVVKILWHMIWATKVKSSSNMLMNVRSNQNGMYLILSFVLLCLHMFALLQIALFWI